MLANLNHSAKDDAEISLEQIKTDINFINTMLAKLNMDSPFPLLNLPEDAELNVSTKFEISRACAILIPLLTSKYKEQNYRLDVEGRVELLAKELADKNSLIVRQQARIEQLERELNLTEIHNRYR